MILLWHKMRGHYARRTPRNSTFRWACVTCGIEKRRGR